MTLFDETNANYSDSNTTTLTEQQPPTEGLTEQSTVEASPAESSATEQTSQEEPKAAAADDF